MQSPYNIEIGEKLQRKIKKLENKDSHNYNIIINKIIQIAETPQLGKPLREFLKESEGFTLAHLCSSVNYHPLNGMACI